MSKFLESGKTIVGKYSSGKLAEIPLQEGIVGLEKLWITLSQIEQVELYCILDVALYRKGINEVTKTYDQAAIIASFSFIRSQMTKPVNDHVKARV